MIEGSHHTSGGDPWPPVDAPGECLSDPGADSAVGTSARADGGPVTAATGDSGPSSATDGEHPVELPELDDDPPWRVRRPTPPGWAALSHGTGLGRMVHVSAPLDVPGPVFLWLRRVDIRLRGVPGWREGPVEVVSEDGTVLGLEAAWMLADALHAHGTALEALADIGG